MTHKEVIVASTPRDVPRQGRVDLYWLPLGAGESSGCVRWNGRMFEALAARRDHRPRCDLFHSALEVRLDDARFTIEMTPVWGNGDGDRGVVSTGPVGVRLLGLSRIFRYEVRRWRDGTIPDLAAAVGGPRCVTEDVKLAQRLLDLVPDVPNATWGRDEWGTGDMWNSNSLTSWLLARSGVLTESLMPPPGGRAPGWAAGLIVAKMLSARDRTSSVPGHGRHLHEPEQDQPGRRTVSPGTGRSSEPPPGSSCPGITVPGHRPVCRGGIDPMFGVLEIPASSTPTSIGRTLCAQSSLSG